MAAPAGRAVEWYPSGISSLCFNKRLLLRFQVSHKVVARTCS
jgi:hypothetical protein